MRLVALAIAFAACDSAGGGGRDTDPDSDADSDADGCGPDEERCGDACARLDRDEANCGACGRACAAGESCLGGACAEGPDAGGDADSDGDSDVDSDVDSDSDSDVCPAQGCKFGVGGCPDGWSRCLLGGECGCIEIDAACDCAPWVCEGC